MSLIYYFDYLKLTNLTFTSTFGAFVKVPATFYTTLFSGGTNQMQFPFPGFYHLQFQCTGTASNFLFVMYNVTQASYVGSTTSSAFNYSVQETTLGGTGEKTVSLLFPVENDSDIYELRVRAPLTTDTLSFKSGQLLFYAPRRL